jgi:hypothetical protein
VTGSHEHECTIPVWVDGKTQAHIAWTGWDGPGRQSEPERFEQVIASAPLIIVVRHLP